MLLFKEQLVYSTTFGSNIWLPRYCQVVGIKWSRNRQPWLRTKNTYAQVL